MKILYVVSRPLEINSSASIRNLATIIGLTELGHEVKLITTLPDVNHPNYNIIDIPSNLEVKYIKLNGTQKIASLFRRYKVLKPLRDYLHNYISNSSIYDNLLSIINFIDKIEINDDSFDLVISSSDPKSSHLFVHKLYEKKLLEITPWIQIWGDPFSTDISIKNRKIRKKLYIEEKKLLVYPFEIIYLSKLTLDDQINLFKEFSNKMRYVPAPFKQISVYPKNSVDYNLLNILYSGDFNSTTRNILPLYEAVKKTMHKLVICGSSNIQLSEVNNINVLPRLSLDEVKKLEEKADILVHLSNLSGSQIPGKIYQYIGTNKPVLFILDGQVDKLSEIFLEYNRFVFCLNSIDSIFETLKNFQKLNSLVSNDVQDKFAPVNIAQEIIKFV
ncbi:hypothetical protein [Peloplasma aerotolerans]|uniref:Glycosyltransferase family 4 protein n=1 Tax=Peloplasma aerotolerans TaxID=3044389 RepID=A0AAW6U9P8_9MOLU|nr:hypothetical protein [Mariniplasma sp. M4Ah]MDI6452379.1 hypothetical protein [Mariniplasma sp. M4Ah]